MATETAFTPDFFNSVASVAVVLMFAKFVTHRSRKPRHGRKGTGEVVLIGCHIAAVLAALIATVASLVAVDQQDVSPYWRLAGWWGLAIAGSLLVGDVLVEDFTSYKKHRPNEADRSSTTSAP
jgi:cytosine/uracil/thiamine/allantoin permease